MSETATQTNMNFGSCLDNSQEVSRIEQLKNKKITAKPQILAFAGLSLVGVMLAGFLALQIITGVLALGVTAVACVGGYFGIRWLKHLSPVMQQKMKNKQLKMMTEEARKNAIYQLENQVLENDKRLQSARRARNKMGATIERLKSKVDHSRKGEPIYEQKIEVIARLEAAYEQVIENLEKGAEANRKFEQKVADYKDLEDFTGDANEAMALFNDSGDKKLKDMLSLESFNHIESEFSEALISIENSARDMQVDGD